MKKRYRGLTGFLGAVSVLLLLGGLWVPVFVSARTDGANLYEESLTFDSQGNLCMTTHDKKAEGEEEEKEEEEEEEEGGRTIHLL